MQNEETPNIDVRRNSLSLFRMNRVKEAEKEKAALQQRIDELEKACSQLKTENEYLRKRYERFLNQTEMNSNPLMADQTKDTTTFQTNGKDLNLNLESITTPSQNQNNNEQFSHPAQPMQTQEYYTDEEELNEETGWIVERNRKKRKRLEKVHKNAANRNEERIETEIVVNGNSVENTENKKYFPPPITVTGIENYIELYEKLKSWAKQDFKIILLQHGTYKINLYTEVDYREITRQLNTEKYAWFTYEDKQARPIRVIVKRLDHTCDPELIVQDLISQGFKANGAVLKLNQQNKQPHNMFYLSFDPSEDINKIYNIKTILSCVVKIEPINTAIKVPQCKNCQSYGHTKNYCSKAPRCVKCAGRHESSSCTKPGNILPKCANCGESHPASYRGCVVAKELQKIRNNTLKQKRNQPQHTVTSKESHSTQRADALHREILPQKSQGKPKTTFNQPRVSSQTENNVIPTLQSNKNANTYSQILKLPTNESTNTSQILPTLTHILNTLKRQEANLKTLSNRLDFIEQTTSTNARYA